ncbi:type I glyceraldehyde-3-phosphate dehydrogenase [bacterium]|nr:type I glyceraldehyde-3-phosphate dehydrogenase [bacterium]
MVRLAINGFGRIGRAAFKVAVERDDVEIVAINDLGDVENLVYLLKYDSVYGRYGQKVSVSGDTLQVGSHTIKALAQPDPESLPWKDMDVDVVIESTGFFTDEEGAGKHLTAGAKRVVISAPTKSTGVPTVVLGVNNSDSDGQSIISNASCSTNCATPVMSIMDNEFGVEKALLTTIHSYTATQALVDGPAKKDPRRGRAAAQNLIPSSTGAAIAATLAYEPMKDKFDGVSVRVPSPVVSIADLVMLTKSEVRVEEINQAFVKASESPLHEGIVGYTEDPNVSTDFIQDPRSAIVDLSMTRVVSGNLVKIMAWYDNEWGYSNRLVEQAVAAGA